MIKERIELCDGLEACFDTERNLYKVVINWLNRDIDIWLSTSNYHDENEVAGMIASFEKFYNDKENLLARGQNDIKENLLPYIAEHESPEELLPYPKVLPDDFDADYWLTDAYVIGGIDQYIDVQLNFNRYDDEDRFEELSILRTLNNNSVEYLAGQAPVDL